MALPREVARIWLSRWDSGNDPPKGPDCIEKWIVDALAYGRRPIGCGRVRDPAGRRRKGKHKPVMITTRGEVG